jgi:hypothetical protein
MWDEGGEYVQQEPADFVILSPKSYSVYAVTVKKSASRQQVD